MERVRSPRVWWQRTGRKPLREFPLIASLGRRPSDSPIQDRGERSPSANNVIPINGSIFLPRPFSTSSSPTPRHRSPSFIHSRIVTIKQPPNYSSPPPTDPSTFAQSQEWLRTMLLIQDVFHIIESSPTYFVATIPTVHKDTHSPVRILTLRAGLVRPAPM